MMSPSKIHVLYLSDAEYTIDDTQSDVIFAEIWSLCCLHFPRTGWHERFPDNPLFKPMEKVNKLVSEGKLGMKTGEGFYSHQKK